MADTLRNGVELKTINVGYFSKEENVVTGEDIVTWFKKELNASDLEEIKRAVNGMVEQELLHSPSGHKDFQGSAKELYRFQVDEPGSAANMLKIYKGPAKDSVQLTSEIVIKCNELLKEVRVEVSPGEVGLLTEKLKNCNAYKELKKMICELQTTPITNLNKTEKLVCFLNIYQVRFFFLLT